MKQFLLLTGGILALSANFFISAPADGADSDIVINEIGAFPTSTHEWVEIWNKGSEPVDLAGWKFWEDNTNHALTVSSTDSVLLPGKYGAICQDSLVCTLDHPNLSSSIFDSSWSSLNEQGEEIGLKDTSGNFIEQFTYQPATKHSLERKNPLLADYSSDNWQENATGDTLGFQNSNYVAFVPVAATSTTSTEPTPTSTPPTTDTSTPEVSAAPFAPSTSSLWAQIKINEFLPNPESGDEWVELYNPATTSLDLAAGSLCDSRDTNCDITTTTGTILAQDWTTFFLSGSHLNNDGDSVILKNPEGVIVDHIDYGTGSLAAPEKGQTIARINDGVDTDSDTDWAITITPTLNAKNVITEPPAPPINSGGGGSSGGSTDTTTKTSTNTKSKNTTSTVQSRTKSAPAQTKIIWKLSVPHTAAPLETTEFSAAGSADPRGGILFISWNLGDGTIIDGRTISHMFATSGIYRISVFATSTEGTIGQENFSLVVASGLSAHQGEVCISEVYPDPPGADQDEFIELSNAMATSTMLSGWKLETSSGKSFTIPEKTIIKPGGYLVFYRIATKLILDNTKEIITLKTPDDIVADQITYSKSVSGQSLSLLDNEYVWTADITPGLAAYSKPVTAVLGEKVVAQKPVSKSIIKIPARLALADARVLAKGKNVSVQGIVTAPPGALSEHYFYIADSSGGLQIYSSKKDLLSVTLGDSIRVVGSVSAANGTPRIKITSAKAINILAANQPILAEQFKLEDIDEDAAGKLITVSGEITDIKGNLLYLDDGETEAVVYLKTAAQIDKSQLKSGDTLQVTGIVEQTKSGWQIWPRSTADLALQETDKTGAATSSTTPAGDRKKYFVFTLSGLGLVGLAVGLRWYFNRQK